MHVQRVPLKCLDVNEERVCHSDFWQYRTAFIFLRQVNKCWPNTQWQIKHSLNASAANLRQSALTKKRFICVFWSKHYFSHTQTHTCMNSSSLTLWPMKGVLVQQLNNPPLPSPLLSLHAFLFDSFLLSAVAFMLSFDLRIHHSSFCSPFTANFCQPSHQQHTHTHGELFPPYFSFSFCYFGIINASSLFCL